MRSDRRLLVALSFLAAALAPRAQAQTVAGSTGSIVAATELRAAPDGRVLASLHAGAPVRVLGAKGAWTQVTMEGWLHVSVIGPKRDSFPLSVKSPNGALMRVTADRTAEVAAMVEDGMGLQEVQHAGQWTQVRRVGWILAKMVKPGPPPSAAVRPAGTPTPSRTANAGAGGGALAPANAPDAPSGDVAVAHATPILAAPTGAALGTLDSATRLTTGASEKGWVRVTLEGWVRERDLIPLDSAPISAISAADLRTDPDRYRGQTVRWAVQVVAYQIADPLRKGLANDEPYLLARGPGSESALLYLAIPPSLIESAKELPPLSIVVILARVRAGRSDPSGVPILDVQRIIRR